MNGNDTPQIHANTDRSPKDREALEKLYRSKPLHLMQLMEWTGRVAPRKERESFWYRLREFIGGPQAKGSPRVLRLEKEGAILGYRAVIDPALLDTGQVVFVQVALGDSSRETRDAFIQAVHGIPEIETCHMVTGDFEYMLQVRTRSVEAFHDLLTDRIDQLPSVARSATIIAMKTIKDR